MRAQIVEFLRDESGFLPALIGAGASLLGGALQSREQRRHNDRVDHADRTRLQRMRADAEAAGFNPLTALHATGGGPGPAFFAPTGAMGAAVADAGAFFSDAMQRRTQRRHEQAAQGAARSQQRLARVNRAHQNVEDVPTLFDHDYRDGFIGVGRRRPVTRTSHFNRLDVPVTNVATMEPARLTRAQAVYLGLDPDHRGPAQALGNTEVNSLWGFKAAEVADRPGKRHQQGVALQPYNPDEPVRVWSPVDRALRWFGTQFGEATGFLGAQARIATAIRQQRQSNVWPQ